MGNPKEMLSRPKVLIIDNSNTFREIAAFLLFKSTNEPCAIYIAENGEDGISQCEKCQPDIVITDFRAPKLNGVKLIQRLSQTSSHPHLIVITDGLTLHASSQEKTETYLKLAPYLGADIVMDRDSIVEQLPKAVNRILDDGLQKRIQTLKEHKESLNPPLSHAHKMAE